MQGLKDFFDSQKPFILLIRDRERMRVLTMHSP